MFSFILVVCLAGVFCLAPLTLYLMWLSVLNRRDRPTVVSGSWDFAALLVGLSGFAIFGGGLLLSLLQSNFRFLMRGNFEALRDAWGQERFTWSVIVAAYVILILGGSLRTLIARQRILVLYNVDPANFELALAEIMELLGRPVERRGNVWVGGVPLYELELFPGGRSAVVRWLSEDHQLFQEVERQIRETSPGLYSGENPLARWISSGMMGSSILVVFCLVLLVYGLAIVR